MGITLIFRKYKFINASIAGLNKNYFVLCARMKLIWMILWCLENNRNIIINED
jgi:hypothetical protein